MKRRNWSLDEKLAIVLEGIKGERSISEICRVHQISQSLYYKWRDKVFEGAKKGLSNGIQRSSPGQGQLEDLQKIIGKQTIQIEILKKTDEYFRTK